MAKRTERFQDEKGPTARHLVLMFLALAAICAVFFSLGFVVGYNRSPSHTTPVTENVGGSGNIPPTVNQPLGSSSQPSGQSVQAENVNPDANSFPPPVRLQTAPSEPVAPPKPHKSPVVREKEVTPRKMPVKKPTPVPEKRHSEATHTPSASSKYVVQVMASRTRQDAVRLVRLLESRSYHVFILTPQQAHASDHLYRVQVGPFSSHSAALGALHRLEGEGFRPFIIH